MRWACYVVVLLLPACFHPNYDHPACGPGGACPSGLQCSAQGFCELPDAGPGNGAGPGNDPIGDAGVAPDAPRSAFCSVLGTVACYEFEGNARDGSGNGLDPIATPGIQFAPGEVGQAVLLGSSCCVSIQSNILFNNVSKFTIETWIRPSVLPEVGAAIIVGSEYWLSIGSDGTLRGVILGPGEVVIGDVVTATTVPVGQWTHVAFTYDGVAANVYINGSVAATSNVSGAIANGAYDMVIVVSEPTGMPLVALIDQLRLLNVARSAVDICTDAGKTSCP